MNLAGKVALITGGARGIGWGCAEALARNGATIVLNDRPGSPDLATAAEEIRKFGVDCTPIEANAFARSGCEAILQQVLDVHGRIDILVSNPARSVRSGFLEFDPDVFEDVIRGTLIAGFHMGQLVARQMVAQGDGGKLVFISSVHAEMPIGNAAAYNAAKSGLNHLALTIAAELCGHRINVNVIEPGWIDTPGERQTFGDAMITQQGPALPWGRLGTPADIGAAVAFLCSPDADYITGSILAVDGGFRWKDCRPSRAISPNNQSGG